MSEYSPRYATFLIACVVGYASSPIDLIPDFIPVLGYVDDLILVPAGIDLAIKMKAFSERILKRMEPGDEIKTYWFESNGLFYYTKKPYIEAIESPDRLIEVFRSSHRVFIVILVEMFDNVKRDAGIEIEPIEKAQVGHWEYVLVSNR